MAIDAVLARGLKELGIYEALEKLPLDPHGRTLPYAERCQRWEEFKQKTKKRYRKLARELHPDANQELPESERKAKEERLQSLSRAVEAMESIAPRPEQPTAVPAFAHSGGMVVIVVGGVNATYSSNTASSTTGWPFGYRW
jgi:DnaJ domain